VVKASLEELNKKLSPEGKITKATDLNGARSLPCLEHGGKKFSVCGAGFSRWAFCGDELCEQDPKITGPILSC
jgi:hypothetical protein